MRRIPLLLLLLGLPFPGDAQSLDAAIALYQHGKFADAAGMLTALSAQHPENAALQTWLGKSWLKLRKWNEAIDRFKKAIALEPGNSMIHLWLARAYGNKASNVNFFSAFGLARQARDEFEAAVKLDPAGIDARFDLLEYYAQAPGIVGGGRDKAEGQAEAIAKLSPQAGYTARADILESDKKWDQARELLTEAIRKFPESAAAFTDLAEFLVDRRDYSSALTVAGKAVQLEGSNRHAIMLLAAAEAGSNQNLSHATEALEQLAAGPLTDDDPAFEEVYYWLGQARLAGGEKEKARQAFETSLRFDPDYERSKDALAAVRKIQ